MKKNLIALIIALFMIADSFGYRIGGVCVRTGNKISCTDKGQKVTPKEGDTITIDNREYLVSKNNAGELVYLMIVDPYSLQTQPIPQPGTLYAEYNPNTGGYNKKMSNY